MSNFIIEFKQAFSAEFCQGVMAKFDQDPNQYPGRTGGGVDREKKDSLDMSISDLVSWQKECTQIEQTLLKALVQYTRLYPFMVCGAVSPSIKDPVSGKLRTISHQDLATMNDGEIAQLVASIYQLDKVNLQRYSQGQGGYHHWHSEHYPHPSDPEQRALHRVLLWLVYLNDVDQGGETEFFFQQAKVKPTQGSLVLAPCTFTHTHRGCVPQSNDKYVMASWVMYKQASQIYAQQ